MRPHQPAVRQFVLLLCCAQAALAAAAAEPAQPGLMLRPGNWDGDIGTYQLPAALQSRKPAQWPNDGWQRLTLSGHLARIDVVAAAPRQRPAFLATIAAQVAAAQSGRSVDRMAEAAAGLAAADPIYLRFPGQPLRQGEVTLYRFRNGTATLTPKLDHRYELALGTQPFAFTVRDSPRGASYSIDYGGSSHDYSLPGYGWDSRVKALADFDGDGKPDFLIEVAGNNSVHEYLLLSTQARPGRNPPSASLSASGC